MGAQNVETIKMVENAMHVLDLLRASKEPIGVNAIAKTCALTPSTTYRILKTLEMTGWVYQFNDDDRYIAGEKISFITSKNNFYMALRDSAKFIMEETTAKVGLAMNLMVRNGYECEILEQSLTKSIINYVPPIHAVLPYYACGCGKVLLSELPEDTLSHIFTACKMQALTPFTITDPEKYRSALTEVRKNGYAIDFQESSIDGSCIAVPVRDKENTIIAALSFSGLIGVQDPNRLLKYIPALQDASNAITKSLYNAWGK